MEFLLQLSTACCGTEAGRKPKEEIRCSRRINMVLLTYGEGITIGPATSVLKRSFTSRCAYGNKTKFSSSVTLSVKGGSVKPVFCEKLAIHPMTLERSFVSTVEYDVDSREVSFVTHVFIVKREHPSKLSAREMWDLAYEVAYRYYLPSEKDPHQKEPVF